jgi:predicted esterase
MTHPRSMFIAQNFRSFSVLPTTNEHQRHRKHSGSSTVTKNKKLNASIPELCVFRRRSPDYNDSKNTVTVASTGGQSHPGSANDAPRSNLAENVEVKAAKDLPGQFPKPIIALPQLEHRQTFIMLPGRGSTAEKFAPPLLETASTSREKLQTAFPHAKLVFLTASRNRATIYKRSLTHQWFDHWHMEEPNKRQDLMRAGLHKSCKYVHGILQQEIAAVGKENVVLWGLSQGCATSLTSLLTWDGEPFAATVGMCAYLPFANHIEEIAKDDNSDNGDDLFGKDEDDDDPFSYSGDEDGDSGIFELSKTNMQDRSTEAIALLRDEIDMDEKTGMLWRMKKSLSS